MNSIFSFFDPVEINEPEVKLLYRKRENDPEYKNHPGKLVDHKLIYDFKDYDGWLGQSFKIGFVPVDPHWQKMNDSERLENGFPTKFDAFYNHPLFFGAFILLSDKIRYGYASIFQNILSDRDDITKSKKGRFFWIPKVVLIKCSKRLPISLVFAFTIYHLGGNQLKYKINYYSDEEEEIERKYNQLSK